MPEPSPQAAADKHVIILGADASAESGYPMADGLRVCLASTPHLFNLWKDNTDGSVFPETWNIFFEARRAALNFFSKGTFASVDEFCKVASESADQEIQKYGHQIRRLAAVILSCVNPEKRFQNSEYYAFV